VESSLKMLQLVRIFMVGSLVIYALLGEWLAHAPGSPKPVVFYAIAIVGITMIALIFPVRRATITLAAATLAANPDDRVAMTRWRMGHLLTFAMCEAVGLYGLVLRFMGFPLSRTWFFYVAAILLMLYFAPQSPSKTLS